MKIEGTLLERPREESLQPSEEQIVAVNGLKTFMEVLAEEPSTPEEGLDETIMATRTTTSLGNGGSDSDSDYTDY